MDYLQEPHLPPIERTQLPIFSSVPSSEREERTGSLIGALESCDFNSSLVSTIQDLIQFSQALDYALTRENVLFHPRAFDEDMILIQRALLAAPEAERNIERACRVGALIYIKSITKEFPHSASTSKILVQKLKSSLNGIAEDSRIAPLLLWLFFMGGVASQGTSERAWFVAHLVRMTIAVGRVPNWEGVKAVLRKVLWVENIHGRICKMLWDEVVTTRTVLNGQML